MYTEPPNTLANGTVLGPFKSQVHPLRAHEFSPFKMIPGRPEHLAPASFHPSLMTGNTIYCHGPAASTENNHALVERAWCWAPRGREPPTPHSATWGLCLLQKTPPAQLEGPRQVLQTCHVLLNPREQTLGSVCHSPRRHQTLLQLHAHLLI